MTALEQAATHAREALKSDRRATTLRAALSRTPWPVALRTLDAAAVIEVAGRLDSIGFRYGPERWPDELDSLRVAFGAWLAVTPWADELVKEAPACPF